MKNFLLELANQPNSIVKVDTELTKDGFLVYVGDKVFNTTPAETNQIINVPGFDNLDVKSKSEVILGTAQAMSIS
ncbi:MAG: hypothetical protein EOO61_05510 [Hymenobacter sp.]|nr:MAG: hypothetical protein EOO61_05510 [Hymenobacter sp.]